MIPPRVYCIHDTDAFQHIAKMESMMSQFKAEKRIEEFVALELETALLSLENRAKENDIIVILLTVEVGKRRNEISNLISKLKSKSSRNVIVEIVVDNVAFENEYITLPQSLKPIRDTQDIDATWQDIGEDLKVIMPIVQTGLTKYVKYAVPVLILLIVLVWSPWKKDPSPLRTIPAETTTAETTTEEATPMETTTEAPNAETTSPTHTTSNDPLSDFAGGSTRIYSADFSQWNLAQTEHGVVSLGFGNSYVLQPYGNTWIGSATQPIPSGLTGDFVFHVRFRIEEPNPSSALHFTLTGDGNDAESIDVYFDFWGPGNVDYSLSKGRVRSGGGLAVPHAITEETIAERVKAPARVLNHNWAQGGKLTMKREGLEMQFFINDVFVKKFNVSMFPVVKTSIGVAFASKVTITSVEGRLKS